MFGVMGGIVIADTDDDGPVGPINCPMVEAGGPTGPSTRHVQIMPTVKAFRLHKHMGSLQGTLLSLCRARMTGYNALSLDQ